MNGAACEVAGFVSNRPSVSRCRRWCVWRRRSVVSRCRLRRRKALETCWSSTLESGTFLCVQWTGVTTLGALLGAKLGAIRCGRVWTAVDMAWRSTGSEDGACRLAAGASSAGRATYSEGVHRDRCVTGGFRVVPDTGGALRSALEASAQFPRALSRGIQRVDQIDPTIKSVSPCVSWGQIFGARRAVPVLGVDSYA